MYGFFSFLCFVEFKNLLFWVWYNKISMTGGGGGGKVFTLYTVAMWRTSPSLSVCSPLYGMQVHSRCFKSPQGDKSYKGSVSSLRGCRYYRPCSHSPQDDDSYQGPVSSWLVMVVEGCNSASATKQPHGLLTAKTCIEGHR